VEKNRKKIKDLPFSKIEIKISISKDLMEYYTHSLTFWKNLNHFVKLYFY